MQRLPVSASDDVIVSHKFDELPPPSGLLVASENILKSCPGSTIDGDENGELLPTCALDDTSPSQADPPDAKTDDAPPLVDPWTRLAVGCEDTGELCAQPFLTVTAEIAVDDLPQLSCRPPVRRQLQSAEQRIRAHQRHNPNESPTLRDMQKILIRTKRHSAASAQDGSTSGTSSLLESDTSSLDSHSGDESAAVYRLPVRRNSKSSSGGSTGDSAVGELGSSPKCAPPLLDHLQAALLPRPRSMTCLPTAHFADILPAVGKVKHCKETYERQSTPHNDNTNADPLVRRGSVNAPPVAPPKKSGRKFFEKFFTRQKSDEKSDSTGTPQKRFGDARKRGGPERAKSQSSPTDPGSLFHAELRGTQSGKVQNQREKLERLSRDNRTGPESEHGTPVGVRRIASNAETRRSPIKPPKSAAMSEENMVRSLVGVFEGGSSASLPTSSAAAAVKDACLSNNNCGSVHSVDCSGRVKVLFGIASPTGDDSSLLRTSSMKMASDWSGHVRSSRSLTVGDVGGSHV
jgi:hypothetical protein